MSKSNRWTYCPRGFLHITDESSIGRGQCKSLFGPYLSFISTLNMQQRQKLTSLNVLVTCCSGMVNCGSTVIVGRIIPYRNSNDLSSYHRVVRSIYILNSILEQQRSISIDDNSYPNFEIVDLALNFHRVVVEVCRRACQPAQGTTGPLLPARSVDPSSG